MRNQSVKTLSTFVFVTRNRQNATELAENLTRANDNKFFVARAKCDDGAVWIAGTKKDIRGLKKLGWTIIEGN